MPRLTNGFLFVFACLASVWANAQHAKFDYLNIENGLSQNNILCMEFDTEGYLWAGTLDGLNRYDGHSFEVFKPNLNEPGHIAGNQCHEIAAGKNGDIWVLTDGGGLDYFDAQQNKFRHVSNAFGRYTNPEGRRGMVVDAAGTLWYLSRNTLYAMDTQSYAVNSWPTHEQLWGIEPLPQGGVLLYGDKGVFCVQNQQAEKPQQVFNQTVRGMCRYGKALLCLLRKGVVKTDYTFGQIDSLRLPVGALKSTRALQKVPMLFCKGSLWLGSYGLSKITLNSEPKQLEHFSNQASNPNSITGHYITHLRADKNGNVWIGTLKHGLNCYGQFKNQFKHIVWDYNQKPDWAIDPVRAICPMANGDLWLGFDRAGIGILHRDGSSSLISTYQQNKQTQTLGNVRDILQDDSGDIWVAFNNGICVYNKQTNKLEQFNQKPRHWHRRSYALERLDSGKVLLSSDGQLDIVSAENRLDKHGSLLRKLAALPTIRDIEIDPQNNIWLATNGRGLVYINRKTKQVKAFASPQIKFSNGKIYAIKYLNGYLWLATHAGLNKFNTKTLRVEAVYAEKDGLANNIVYAIDADKNGNLWMSCNRGISKLNPQTEQFSTFLHDNFFMDDAFGKDQKGNLYFGGYGGLIAFNPKDIPATEPLPLPRIEQFRLSERLILAGDTLAGKQCLPSSINKVRQIELDYTQNTFSFRLNATPFNLPNNYRFRYRLAPWNAAWQTLESISRTARFTNVQPGKYTLEVQLSNPSGQWSKTKQLDIIILPPFWKKTWFQLLVIVCILFLIGLYTRLRIVQAEQQSKLLGEQVAEQTRDLRQKNEEIKRISEQLHEADQAKLRFFTNVSHEFRTPLTVILGYLEGLEHENTKKTRSIIRNNAMRLLRLVNQLIEFRKIDLKQVKLHISKIDLDAMLHDLCDSLSVLAAHKNIELDFDSIGKSDAWLDYDKLEKIAFNLVSNAIKYSPKGKKIWIRLLDDDQHYQIQVIDQGMGIKDEDLEQIFNRFFRTENNQAEAPDGHGIGLSLVKELVELMQGKIEVSSEWGNGTCFSVSFKKGNAHFRKEDFMATKKQSKPVLPEIKPNEEPQQPNYKDTHVLLVEDNVDLRNYLKDILSIYYQVSTAQHGKEALELLENEIPDLIVSDIMMPEMDGIAFCKLVKENIVSSHIPFVMLTAKTDNLSKINGFSLGIDDYIEKPFQKELFLTRIKALLENRKRIKRQLAQIETTAKVDKNKVSARDMEFWDKLNAILHSNLGDATFTMETLSEQMLMSRSTFYRKFKALTGENAADYFRKMRLQKAAELLREKKMPVQQVCNEVGFSSVAQFRIKFREMFGKNPSEYE